MQIICYKCGYIWEYKGQMKYTANCPDCNARNNLKTQIEAQEIEINPPALHTQDKKEVNN